MKVAQVVWRLGVGGLENLARRLATRASGPDSLIICLRDHGEWGMQLAETGFPTLALNRREGFDLPLIRRLAKVFKEHKVSIAHLHGYSPFLYGGIAAKLARIPSVYTEHATCYQGKPSGKRRLANRVLQHWPDQVTVCSESIRQFLTEAEGFTRPIDLVPNGLKAVEPEIETRQRVRAELGIPDDAFLMLSVGRFEPVKGFRTLAEAGMEFVRQTNGYLVIVGDGSEHTEVANLVAEENRIILPGYDSAPARFFDAADGYTNSSLDEAASLSVLQAMSYRLPVIATNVGGNPELIFDGINGRLVPPTKNRLAEAMTELANNYGLAQAFGEAGHKSFTDDYTETAMFAAYDRIYQKALADKSIAQGAQ